MDKKTNDIWVGLDIGSIGLKAVVARTDQIDYFSSKRTHGKPVVTAKRIIEEIRKKYAGLGLKIITTGAGGKIVASNIDAEYINEFQAITLASKFIAPEARTILEIGGQTSKYILLDDTGILDYGVNGDCAAGTGSFIDQQATRLHYKTEELGDIVKGAEKTARIAGRCSVFAKSDMIHAQQMGYQPDEILKGLLRAVLRNFKASIIKGRKVARPVLFIGGTALNSGMVTEAREALELSKKDLVVPGNPEFISALGCALESKSRSLGSVKKTPFTLQHELKNETIPEPLSTKDVIFLRDRLSNKSLPSDKVTDVYIGLDVGSVSTNLVVLDKGSSLVFDIYTMTRSRPIEVVGECLKEVEEKIGNRINVCGVGTTGSGRELTGELIGADTIRDEITAHKTGALHISKTMTDSIVDTIFEIGGQDSKFIRIEDGVVTDFTMNEACAAGTGSFLEEQAEKLGINIKDEFAKLALSSKSPLKLGERCTVFMERDIDAYQTRGQSIEDIVAGLSYSVVLNYLNRVVRGRNIGDTIFFQGGTAYNDAVAAAFSLVLGKKIIVPPHNGVIGAVGAALLARDKMSELRTTHSDELNAPPHPCPLPKGERGLQSSELTAPLDPHFRGDDMPTSSRTAHDAQRTTTFKGFDIGKINYSIREFTCKACTNECDIQEFTVDGSKTYWGDKCSSRYRKKAKSSGKTVLADLFKEREEILFSGLKEEKADGRPSIGIPRALYFYDRFPFWHHYLKGLGLRVVVSDETNKKIIEAGISARVAEPCHPIGVAHGHVKNLLDKKVDYVWLPNILTAEPNGQDHVRPYLCPWGMTLPYIVASSPVFEAEKSKFVIPTIHHLHGEKFLSNSLFKEVAKKFKASKKMHREALNTALAAQKKFNEDLLTLGEMALHKLDETGRDAVVLVGRPYNLFDRAINLNVPTKLRNSYGVDVIPYDLLPTDNIQIDDIAEYMFWGYGKKILSASRFMSERDNLHMIYITNFKCGPDSFVKHFAREALGKPFLILQFDEHSNDAGTMTRVEAYLDSKGLLRQKKTRVANKSMFSVCRKGQNVIARRP